MTFDGMAFDIDGRVRVAPPSPLAAISTIFGARCEARVASGGSGAEALERWLRTNGNPAQQPDGRPPSP